jgi:nucleotide-binding universal stress UspA family protein
MTEDDHPGERRIVAGVDGSRPSASALAWAARQAALTGAVVDAVMAWDFPVSFGLVPEIDFDYEGAARELLTSAVSQVAGPVTVRPRLIRGHPAQVLIEASKGAELVVVGSRGHGGFTGSLLGSVSQHCCQHAHCPVVVIRGHH